MGERVASAAEKYLSTLTDVYRGPCCPNPGGVTEQVRAAERRLSLLEKRIAGKKASLDELIRQRDEEQVHINKLKNAASFHGKLPTEMLTEIFEHYLADPIVVRMKKGDRIYPSPYILAQICSTWRVVALNTPTLWNRVHLECGDWQDVDTLVDRVHTILYNSGSIPVSLYTACPETCAYFPFSLSPGVDVGSNVIRRFLEPHTLRIKDLRLSFPSSWLQHFLAVNDGHNWSFPQLQSVELVYNSVEYGDATHKDSVDFFVNSPLLSCFKLTAAHHSTYIRSTLAYILPWSQLTDLRLLQFNVPMPLLPRMLSACTSLISCTLTIMKEYLAPQSLIVIPSLRSLTLNNPHNFDFNKYLEALAFPSLTRLSVLLNGGRASKKWSHCQFMSLLARSACTLQSFHTTAQIEHSDIETILGEVPSLTEIDVQCGQPLSASTLRFICNGLMALNLETIRCVVESSMIHDFLDMLDCRYVPPKSPSTYRGIRNAVIRCDMESAEYKDALERLADLTECGRGVVIKDSYAG